MSEPEAASMWCLLCCVVDAGQLEPKHLLQHQEQTPGQRHETGAFGEERRGLRFSTRHRRP